MATYIAYSMNLKDSYLFVIVTGMSVYYKSDTQIIQ